MTAPEVTAIASRDNPLLKELRRLSQDATAYRRAGRVWLEGDHLCRAALQRGIVPEVAVFADSCAAHLRVELSPGARRIVTLADALFDGISALGSPARMGFVIELPAAEALQPGAASVVLDRLQDAGNVGSILRSAAAFGLRQVIALKGTAALWSPKVLRAGMGAHFGLQLHEGLAGADLDALAVPLIVTSSHEGLLLQDQRLPWPCAWVLGHEGQGVSPEVAARAGLLVRIGQPGGEESLNVAAAAAICLHASALSASGG
ncbi:MAG: RNA methyltransferase [Polaromonas sp.]|uniref:TrmH family RNA methyltransferase n=1 Tax=Polaromonas sp. TaxID=1869339 RepID=UPI00273721A9|nr:RNA methyltransferase [Polaromonas sp.]MDP3245763.1 RNA methyltransferase [Polaromonas sp.]